MFLRIKNLVRVLAAFVVICLAAVFAGEVLAAPDTKALTLTLEKTNEWVNGGTRFVLMNGSVENRGKSTVKGWTVEINFPAGNTLDQGWQGRYMTAKNKLIIENESYNGDIAPGGSVSFGFIAKTSSGFTPSSGTVSAKSSSESKPAQTSVPAATSAAPRSTPAPAPTTKPIKKDKTEDWLYAKGNRIVDSKGNEVWITGINWFGYNTGTNAFDGLWTANLEKSLSSIADKGFNMLRVPISVELIKNWSEGKYPSPNINTYVNPELKGKNSLQVFDCVLEYCRKYGIKVMLDIHSASTDAMGHMKPLWYDGKFSEKDFYNSLEWISARYKNDDTILAIDLKNEPHGSAGESQRAIWNDSDAENNWKRAAEAAALLILKKNPNLLIVIEGIEIYPKDIKKNGDFKSKNPGDYYSTWWGANLRGVKDYPIDLGKYQNKVVYSPHDYGPAVYNQPWFYKGFTYSSLYKDCWRDNWMFIHEKRIAPLLIGEWGGYMTEPNLSWMKQLRTLIINYRLNHTFWCFNANSGDTGGLVKDDFVTWDKEKYDFVKVALWRQDGRFVGLDHDVPLGSNGISLNDIK